MNKTSKTSKKETLRARCERLSAEFSPLLAAKVRQTRAAQIMRQRKGYKFRLNQLVSMDSRLGQVWEQPATSPTFAWLLAFDMAHPRDKLSFNNRVTHTH